MEDAICYGCMVGFHEECNAPKMWNEQALWYKCCCWDGNTVVTPGAPKVITEERLRTPKDPELVRDQTSTGRKRAVAAMEEWERGKDGGLCEWSYLRNAGGGAVPIVGCNGTILRMVKQTENLPEGESPRHIHHGPDKSTLNNGPENLHAICSSCHNRWHALNDPLYAKDRPEHGKPHTPLSGESLPHDSETKANASEVEFSDKFWSLTPVQRKAIPFRVMLEGVKSDGPVNAE